MAHTGAVRPAKAPSPRVAARRAERQRAWLARILELSTLLLAEFGTHTVTLSNLAIGMRVRPCDLRAHFGDLSGLLAHIINLHLESLSAALAQIGPSMPDRAARLAEAYLAHTRNADGSLIDSHKLLVRDRQLLPERRRVAIEQARAQIGAVLGELTMVVLDNPVFDARRDIMFADLFQPVAARGGGCWAAERRGQPASSSTGAGIGALTRQQGEWLH